MAATFFFLLLRYNRRRSSSVHAVELNLRRKSTMSNQVQPASSLKSRVSRLHQCLIIDCFSFQGNVFAAIAVLSQLIFNFLPNLIAFVVFEVIGIELSRWFGPGEIYITETSETLELIIEFSCLNSNTI
jgi:hypothetical protein